MTRGRLIVCRALCALRRDHDWSWAYGLSVGGATPKCTTCDRSATQEEAVRIERNRRSVGLR